MPAASSSRSLMPPSLAAPAPRRPSSRGRTWCESAPVQQLQLGRGPNDEPVASAVRTLGQPVTVVLATTVQARQPILRRQPAHGRAGQRQSGSTLGASAIETVVTGRPSLAVVSALTTASEGRPVTTVSIALAPSVDPDAAAAAWQAAAAGLPLAGAAVRWLPAQDRLACLDCGREYDGDRLTQCPDCAGNGLVVRAAPELELLDWG